MKNSPATQPCRSVHRPSFTLACTLLCGIFFGKALDRAAAQGAAGDIQILQQPQSQPPSADDLVYRVTLTVRATGSEPLNYQWFRNNTALNGRTNSSLPLSGSAAAQLGQYFVVVSNPLGSVTSSVATVSIRADLSSEWLTAAGGRALATDSTGNSYVTGKAPDSTGKVTLAKYDTEGNLLWARGSTAGSSVVLDPAGAVLVGGPFSGSATFDNTTLTAAAAEDSFLVKYDALGNLIWARQAPGVGLLRMAVDGSGNFYFTGALNGTATFGEATLTTRGQRDVLLAKYDGSGSLLWARQAGGPGDDYGTAVALDPEGHCYVTGPMQDTAAFEDKSLTSAGGYDIFLAEYDPNGDVVWVRRYGQAGTDYPNTLFFHSPTIDVAGYVTDSGGKRDVLLVQFDEGGGFRWAQQSGGPNDDYAIDVIEDPRGYIYLTGAIQGGAAFPLFPGAGAFTQKVTEDRGDFEVFVAKYDFFGALVWVLNGGGPNDDFGIGLGRDAGGNLYLTGDFSGSATFPPHSLSAESQSSFLLKIRPQPVITEQPHSQVIDPGTDLKLEVTAKGSGPLYYEWFLNNNPLILSRANPIGVTQNPTLTVSNSDTFDAGRYSVLVRNFEGLVRSEPAIVKVRRVVDFAPLDDRVFGVSLPQTFNANAPVRIVSGPAVFDSFNTHIVPTGTGVVVVRAELPESDDFAAAVVEQSFTVYPMQLFENSALENTSPTFSWVIPGNPGTDYASDNAVNENGQVYVIGQFSGSTAFGQTTLMSRGVSDIFLTKYDDGGNVIWAAQAGGEGEDFAKSIALDGAGNVYVAGGIFNQATFGSDTLLQSPNRVFEVFVAKYDPQGTLLWVRMPGGPFSTAFFDSNSRVRVGTDRAGNVYLSSGVSIAKLAADGNLLWTTQNMNDQAVCLAVEPSGMFYVSGPFFLNKYSADGALLWAKRVQTIQSLAVDGSGNLYAALTGRLRLQKYDSLGNLVWTAGSLGRDDNSVLDLALDARGNIYLTGAFTDTNSWFAGPQPTPGLSRISAGTSDGTRINEGYDIYAAKYDSAGNLRWVVQAGGKDNDFSRGIATDRRGNIYLSGAFNGPAAFGPLTGSEPGTFLAKLVEKPAVAFRLEAPAFTAKGFSLQLSGEMGLRYVIEASTDLLQWTPLAPETDLVDSVTVLDPGALHLNRRFYRAVTR